MKYLFLIFSLLFICGCATTTDMVAVQLMNERIARMESAKQVKHYETIEINETVVVWRNGGNVKENRSYRLTVLVDENGNFIIPPEKINRRFEIRN